MTKAKKITLSRVARAADRRGASLEPTGDGSFELVAPRGRFWVATGTTVVGVPVRGLEPGERRTILRWAYTCCRDGLAD